MAYSDGTPPPNGGVECRWGRQKSGSQLIYGYLAPSSAVHTLGAASAIHSGAMDHGELITLVVGISGGVC